MKAYHVEISEERVYIIKVSAESIEEARTIAKGIYENSRMQLGKPRTVNTGFKIILKGETQ